MLTWSNAGLFGAIVVLFFVIAWLLMSRRATKVRDDLPKSESNQLFDQLMTNGCLDCGNHDNFREGPSGGLCTNIFCARCGAGYNIAPVMEFAERIGRNAAYIDPAYRDKTNGGLT